MKIEIIGTRSDGEDNLTVQGVVDNVPVEGRGYTSRFNGLVHTHGQVEATKYLESLLVQAQPTDMGQSAFDGQFDPGARPTLLVLRNSTKHG